MSGEVELDRIEDAFHRTPRCAVHAEREARRVPCARCGSYACEECFGAASETLCVACRQRVGESLAWERDDGGGVFARLWATTVQMLPAPFTAFEGIRVGKGLWSAIQFAVIENVVSYAVPMLLCAPCTFFALSFAPADPDLPRGVLGAAMCGLLAAIPFVVAAFALLGALFTGLLYHLAASVAGGTGELVESLRAALFLQVLAPISAFTWMLGRIPILGIVVTLVGFAGTLVWQTFALAGHARGAHRIADSRGWLVAAVPALATLALVGALMVGVVALVVGMGLDLETPD
ncbi:MAG: YIP1 family protein [Sandaracinaceae bacterium]|nr:YIP1 family protein [Sandaracinaceae bacterium]